MDIGLGKVMTALSPTRTHHHDRIKAEIAAAGVSDRAAQALLALDADHFQFVRRVMKGDVPHNLMQELQTGVEASHFHALSAILRIQNGHGRAAAQEVPAQEVTVGLLADELNLDPSRASRIAADLVERGLLARAVSQQDGRRSVLVPTPAAGALMQDFLHAKWQRTLKLFATWSEADIVAFADLFGRYTQGMREQYPGRG